MKNYYLLTSIIIFLSLSLFAQSPQAFKYQAALRDTGGQLIQNQNVSFQISLLQGSETGVVVYQEMQTATTNDFGLVTLDIGNGVPVIGDFSNINWAAGPYFMKNEMDQNGGTNFTWMGTTQLLSVPFALYAESSGSTMTEGHKINDSDGDTYVDVEMNPDEDTIRFYIGGVERYRFDSRIFAPVNNGKSVFIGKDAGRDDDGTNNSNVFIGFESGNENVVGFENVFIGTESGKRNNAWYNTFIGNECGKYNVNGQYNTFIGNNAGYVNNGTSNVFVGNSSGHGNWYGSGNVFMGYVSGFNNQSGDWNTYIGKYSGYSNLEGDRNIFIGNEAGYFEMGSDRLYIENSNAGKDSALIYGEFDNNILAVNGKMGIGTSAPLYDLDVIGDLNFSGSLLCNGSPLGLDGLWSTNSSGIHYISGKVGIGTDMPQTSLHVNNGDFRITNGQIDFGDQQRVIKYTSANNMSIQSPGPVSVVIDNNNNNTDIAFTIRKDNSDPDLAGELMRVQENNRVGIGTTTPAARLHVKNGDFLVEDSTFCYLMIKSQNENNDAVLELWTGDDLWSVQHDDSDANDLKIKHNYSTKFSIEADGRTGIGTTEADASALLHVNSTTKGFLPPRMNATQIAAIQSPANGLMVYNTSDRHVYVFNTTENIWKRIAYDTEIIYPPFSQCGDMLTDTRDGQLYPTVLIGNQCWMEKNLNIGTMVQGTSNMTNNGATEKYCYGNNSSNCTIYGGLYQWDEMMQYNSNVGAQGICPDGWQIPSAYDWTLFAANLGGFGIAGGKLKETGTVHWQAPNTGATNESGFTGLPGGTREPGGTFGALNYYGYFGSSTMYSINTAYSGTLSYNQTDLLFTPLPKTGGLSVRCIKGN